jgi:hypothetical protein
MQETQEIIISAVYAHLIAHFSHSFNFSCVIYVEIWGEMNFYIKFGQDRMSAGKLNSDRSECDLLVLQIKTCISQLFLRALVELPSV